MPKIVGDFFLKVYLLFCQWKSVYSNERKEVVQEDSGALD